MKMFRRMAILLFLALIAVSVASCSKSKGGTTTSGTPLTIHFGGQTYPEPILAHVKGFFAEELKPYNASVELLTFQSGPPMVEALASKGLDFAAFGDQPAIQAIASGVPLKIVSGIADSTEGNGLLARADSGIKQVKDIKGHKIAAPAGTTSHQLLLIMLEKNGLTLDDIEFVNLANGNIPPSLVAGNVDGAVGFGLTFADPPEGIVRINSADGYKRSVAVIAARTEFIEKYPDISAAVLRALQKAAKWRVDNYDGTLDIVSDWLGNEREVNAKLLPPYVPLLKLGDAEKDAILGSADLLFRNEILSKRPTAEQLFDDRYAVAAGLETYPGRGADTVKR